MANDLSDLSELEPAATDPVASGDDEIRKTRLHVKNWGTVQHYDTGEHKIPSGIADPTAGKSGNLFIHTDQGVLKIDNGTSYRMVNVNGDRTNPFTATTFALSSSYATKATSTVTIPAGANLLIHVQFQLSVGATGGELRTRILVGGFAINPAEYLMDFAANTDYLVHYIGYVQNPADGTTAVSLQAKYQTVGSGNTLNHYVVPILL